MSTQVGPTGAETLVNSLAAEGVDTIFGLPGLQLDYIFDALYGRQDAIRVIHTRQEQATAYMAFGYAQASGRVGTCLVVPGPGVLNATAALSPLMRATRRCFASPDKFHPPTSAAASVSCTKFRIRPACSLQSRNGRTW